MDETDLDFGQKPEEPATLDSFFNTTIYPLEQSNI
jgi:hypothetical protein